MQIRKLSLATKIIATVIATLLVVLGITSYLQSRQEESVMLTSLRDEGGEIAGTLEMTLKNARQLIPFDDSDRVLQQEF
jgi:hypothetical protein